MNKTRVWNPSDRRQRGTCYYKGVITRTRQIISTTTIITIMIRSYSQTMANLLLIMKNRRIREQTWMTMTATNQA